jgi:hypothetical protein
MLDAFDFAHRAAVAVALAAASLGLTTEYSPREVLFRAIGESVLLLRGVDSREVGVVPRLPPVE